MYCLDDMFLDLMASQRREVIPKCSTHTNQELLFCENCDSVFCAACKTSPHSTSQSGSHNVIPFAVAIKRMSEILLYKANECLAKVSNSKLIKALKVYYSSFSGKLMFIFSTN